MGDSLKINNIKIRLYGIDAPELKQKCKEVFLTISFFSFQKIITAVKNLKEL